MTRSELTKSELVRDAANVALSAAIVATGIKRSSKALVITGVTSAVTIVTVDILIAVTRKKIKKNNKEET